MDWPEFLCGLPDRPFSAEQFSGWYGYREFSDGPVPGLGSHFIDLVHYITGASLPQSAVCHGGTFTWKDHGFTCPDHVQATWTYPEGLLVSYTTNFGNSGGRSFRIFGEQDAIHGTDQGKSFRAFWQYMMSSDSQEEMETLLAQGLALPEIHDLDEDESNGFILF